MCSDQAFGSYRSLEEAKTACSSMVHCSGVYVLDCQEISGNIHLCPSEQHYTYSLHYNSCIYHKVLWLNKVRNKIHFFSPS